MTALVLTFESCSGTTSLAPAPPPCAGTTCNPAQPLLRVFSPLTPLVATYAADVRGSVSPSSVLSGSRTQLTDGHGLAVGDDGTTYVLSGSPAAVLVYAPGAKRNDAPEKVVQLSPPLLGDYAVGLALDGQGNIWTADRAGRHLLRFPIKDGVSRPNLSITPELKGPKGWVPASAEDVALDARGYVYCLCNILIDGTPLTGFSVYRPGGSSRKAIVRSFYSSSGTASIPESVLTVDPFGTIYGASGKNTTGSSGNPIFAYSTKARWGSVNPSRFLRPKRLAIDTISALATDADGHLFVGFQSAAPASTSQIAVFPAAHGNDTPLYVLRDKRLIFGPGVYGGLIVVK
jgi:hypothetical protein